MSRAPHWLYGYLLGVLGTPGAVSACTVCGFGQGDRGMAYFIAGWMMSAVPLVLVASIAAYLWYRVRVLVPAGSDPADDIRTARHTAAAPHRLPCGSGTQYQHRDPGAGRGLAPRPTGVM